MGVDKALWKHACNQRKVHNAYMHVRICVNHDVCDVDDNGYLDLGDAQLMIIMLMMMASMLVVIRIMVMMLIVIMMVMAFCL